MNRLVKCILCGMLAGLLCTFSLVGCDDLLSDSGGGSSHGGDKFVPMTGDGRPSGSGSSTTSDETQKPSGNYTKRVAMTFDDGPHETRTRKIVDELAKYGYHATFFVVGNRVDGTEYRGGAEMKYAVSMGNEIGIHAYTHDVYYDENPAEYNEEIRLTAVAIKSVVPNYKVKLLRPAGGKITDAQVAASKYSIIMWGVDSEDWRYRSDDNGVDIIVDNVMSNVRDGSIILMHDIYENTYLATVKILKRLHEEGYEVVTVSELIGKDIKAGKMYYRKPKET